MTELAFALLTAALAGCSAAGSHQDGTVFTGSREVSPSITAACDLTAHRCSRCHPVDRILLARVATPEHWIDYVDRMRHQPESNIAVAEVPAIVRCLVFHSFGSEGLSSFDHASDGGPR